MTRRQDRENAFIALFAFSFGELPENFVKTSREENEPFAVAEFGEGLVTAYQNHAQEIDDAIEGKLKGWKFNRLPKVSLSILRLAITEIMYGEPDMDSVVINEAVEIAKKYGGDDDYQFINGVLGALSREKPSDNACVQPTETDGEITPQNT